MNERILLSHGSGGDMTRQLIQELFVRHFDNGILRTLSDSAILGACTGEAVFTTDSYVVDPIFFPGGDIGKLAVCGTVNDLAVAGANPAYLSAGFIIEEGITMKDLEEVVASMAREARKAGVQIVTGDTKVVNRGKADKIFINTAGIGYLHPNFRGLTYHESIRPGDRILVNGTLGEHGIAVLAARKELNLSSEILSDCACLNGLIADMLRQVNGIRFMRDLTRGGLATALCEMISNTSHGINLWEKEIPVREEVNGACEMLGFDPVYLANEGKFITVVDEEDSEDLVELMKHDPLGRDAAIIGEIVAKHPGRVEMQTRIGGRRIIEMLTGEQLPRIC